MTNKRNINYSLIFWNLFIASICGLATLEVYFRLNKPRFFAWAGTESFSNRLKKAKSDASKVNNLKILVGDSHAENLIGTNSNLYDNIFSCKNYWENINYVFNGRKNNPKNKNQIIISLSYGNDFHEYLYPKNFSNKNCTFFSNYEINEKNLLVAEPFKAKVKRYFPSLNYLFRLYKARFLVNEDKLIKNSRALRGRLFYEEIDNLETVNNYFNKLDEKVIKLAATDQINMWEVGLSLANPFYFEDLYSLKKSWARNGINCMQKDIVNFYYKFKNKFPNSEFIFIGIPDKLIWQSNVNKELIEEYSFLGYEIKNMLNNENILKKEYKNLSENMSDFFEKNQFNYVYLPSLVDEEAYITDWFHKNDMHINKKGNINLSKLLNLEINKILK